MLNGDYSPTARGYSFTDSVTGWRRGSESNEEPLPFRLQLTQVQALEYIDSIGDQALFSIVRSSLVIAHSSPFQRSFGEDSGEDFGEDFSLSSRAEPPLPECKHAFGFRCRSRFCRQCFETSFVARLSHS